MGIMGQLEIIREPWTYSIFNEFYSERQKTLEVISYLQKRNSTALSILESHLSMHNWIAADQFSAADLSCCSYLFYPEDFGFNRKSYPNIDRWLSNIETYENWKHPYDLLERAYPPSKGFNMKEVFIYDAIRTPRGRGRKDGSLHEVTALALSTTVLNNIKKRNELDGHSIEDVIWGNVTQIGEQGACLARTAVLASELDENVPGISINRFCASGLEAVNLAANQIRGGAGNCYIAGGVESMSRVPMSSDGGAVAVDPSFTMNNYFVPQGISADLIATKYGFSRDQADELAVESQKRASIAWNEDRFSKSIVPVTDINGLTILEHDEYIRADTDMQKLGALKSAFQDMGETMPGFDKVALMKYPEIDKINHIHHAGNSSGIVDGAAGILIGDQDFGTARGLKPRAKIRATCKVGTEPTIMLTGPVPATNKILSDSGLKSVTLIFLK